MNELILHPQTDKAIKQILDNPAHAILLTGEEGSGKRFIAFHIAETLLQRPPSSHPYFIHMKPSGKSFTIEQVRELQQSMKLKTTGSENVRRVVVLQDIHTMTIEAQNALLKLLEEPPADTVLILTAKADRTLKPTIYSRVQAIHIKPISKSQLIEASPHIDISNAEKAYLLSGGNVGLFVALAKEETDHPLIHSIQIAKQLLASSTFERLSKIDQLAKDKDELASLLVAMKRIANAALRSAADKDDFKSTRRWSSILKYVYNCEDMLPKNVNPKLLLSELFLVI